LAVIFDSSTIVRPFVLMTINGRFVDWNSDCEYKAEETPIVRKNEAICFFHAILIA